jgi:type II secretory pathway predicted ATPase ExeA
MMYEAHWGLSDSPFQDRAAPRFFHPSPTHEEAIARLHFLIERHRPLGLLLGPAGSGKTRLLEILGEQLRDTGCQLVFTSLVGWDGNQFLAELAHQLRCRTGNTQAVLPVWRALMDRLTENRYQQLTTVLLLDDAQDASPDVLDQVVRLARVADLPDARLTVILAADQARCQTLGHRLLSLSELRIELDPWGPEEIVHYLQSLLENAGASQQLFEPSVAGRVYQLSGGVPRRVCQLAELALAAGAGQDLARIEAETIDAVAHELNLGR